ncbi:ATP-binding protein [Actinomyces lilanjuaniae]|uniref:ATP-binding protein n=1 Tax=Actinomyces lilanjuaniae TaxID=2321394 RepID=A0ABM6Z4F5_9ACTO|nr:ATP-binding protein [Actinomyces lilanjuaniae]
MLAGVCSGVAAHLGVPSWLVRTGFLALGMIGGAGLLLYVLLWGTVPAGDPWAQEDGQLSPARARLATRTVARRPGRTASSGLQGVIDGSSFILAAVLLAAWRLDLLERAGSLVIILIVVAGVALAWSQGEAVLAPGRSAGAVLRLLGGTALAAVGVLAWVASDSPPGEILSGALAGGAVIAGVGAVLVPLWLRTARALTETREAEAREAERADIAAHLHDSVLQTLTLIRRRAAEPETVARLARSQERELRAWLYTDRPEPGTSVSDAFRDLAGEIEDRYSVAVDLVCVGDRVPDRDTEVVVAASREALSNAVRHGAPPVSLYLEAGPDRLEVFVRDRGPGFDPEDVAPDRHGVRESIVARMERHGGSARVRRLETGTEVALFLPAPSAQDA